MMINKTACIFGGTGFIGRQVVRELAQRGVRIKVATRIPECGYFLKPYGSVGQIVPIQCNYNDPASIQQLVRGCDYVVNCIGILYERKKNAFKRVHTDLPANIAKACADEGVERFVHISALGVEEGSSKYAKSKLEGEKAIFANFPAASILRPSVVFGEDDAFFNKFAKLSMVMPFLPLIGGGKTKFQPVFVGDVADAVIKALTLPAIGPADPQGKIYELGGPDVATFKDLYGTLFYYIRRKRKLINLSWPVAKIQASFLSLLPNPLLTRDQVESLKTNTVVTGRYYTFANLGINPTSMHTVLPVYLSRYRSGGRFADVKEAS
jgi:uncharacterized protein YbjT (DUF2867 family)